MKIIIAFFFFVLSIVFSSCTNNTNHIISDEQTPEFIKMYKFTTLPVTIKGCFGNSYNLPLINPDSLQSDNVDGSVSYCTFKTNGNYYAVIRLGLADCALPSLITYEKNGKIIDDKPLGIGWCGSGPGFKCEEFTIIKNDYSIYSSDTICSFDIDSLGREIIGTREHYIIFKKGRLLSSGKIELTDTIRQNLKK